MRRVFISYHHANDQWAKDQLCVWGARYGLFQDMSVDVDDVDDDLPTETIRCVIRDDYLRDSTVTILLVGTETQGRKHVDWELYSSMRDGARNGKSGILVIQLPSTNSTSWHAAHQWEKSEIYPDCTSWVSVGSWDEYRRRHPYLPDRIIDNLMAPNALISVTNWDRVAQNPSILLAMIESAHDSGPSNQYDLARPMRRNNSPTY